MMAPPGEDLKRKTEEEMLASDNLTEEERRRIKRRASNRESARRTRYKRTERLKELEDKKAIVETENGKVVNQIHELEKIYWDALLENRQLKSDIQLMRAARPDISALVPSTLSTLVSGPQPVPADFLNMTLPLGPPAPALQLPLGSAGGPSQHDHLSMPLGHFASTLPGMPGLGGGGPVQHMLSLPPPLATVLPPGSAMQMPPGPTQSMSEMMNSGMPPAFPPPHAMNFTSMLESADVSGEPSAQDVQATMAAMYANHGMTSAGLPLLPPDMKLKMDLGANMGAGLPPVLPLGSLLAESVKPELQHQLGGMPVAGLPAGAARGASDMPPQAAMP